MLNECRHKLDPEYEENEPHNPHEDMEFEEQRLERERGHADQIYNEMKDAQYVELETLAQCEAWIRKYYPSACVIRRDRMIFGEGYEVVAQEIGSFGRITAEGETPELALQNVISQIIKWRQR